MRLVGKPRLRTRRSKLSENCMGMSDNRRLIRITEKSHSVHKSKVIVHVMF